ncbi:MAG: hypothetical protein WCO82_04475 [Sphingomonadales bacterium]
MITMLVADAAIAAEKGVCRMGNGAERAPRVEFGQAIGTGMLAHVLVDLHEPALLNRQGSSGKFTVSALGQFMVTNGKINAGKRGHPALPAIGIFNGLAGIATGGWKTSCLAALSDALAQAWQTLPVGSVSQKFGVLEADGVGSTCRLARLRRLV